MAVMMTAVKQTIAVTMITVTPLMLCLLLLFLG